MYELIQVSERCYYIESPAKVGLVKCGENEVVLIDSGSDKDAARKVKKHLDTNGWTLKAIFNTHSHADHTGGNDFLQSRTGCKVYACGIERDVTAHPVLEPSALWGGFPGKELRNKFLMAHESNAELLTADVLPEGMEIIPLPGHCFEMVGFKVDDVIYLADCLSSRETLEKYGIGYLWDVEGYISTLEAVKTMEARTFVPSHAAPTDSIAELAQFNIDSALSAADAIESFCIEPITFEEILQKLFTHYGMTMTMQQYALIGSTLHSYLSWLCGKGRLAYKFEYNRMLWYKA